MMALGGAGVGHTAGAARRPRLLAVAGAGPLPDDLPAALRDAGFEFLPEAGDFDEALRQAIMGLPDVILAPYLGELSLAFLQALDYLRSGDFSPFVVLVADGADYGRVLDRCEGCYRVSVVERERLEERLAPHLARLARTLLD